MSTSRKHRPRLRSRLLAVCALVAWTARSLWRDPRVFSIEIHTFALLAQFEQLVRQQRLPIEDAEASIQLFEQIISDTKAAQRVLRADRQAHRIEIDAAIKRAQHNLARLRVLAHRHA